MDDDFEAAAAIASMATSVAAAESRGNTPPPPGKVGAPPKKNKKELTPRSGLWSRPREKAGGTHRMQGPIPGFHVYPQGSRFSGECSPEVSIVAPSTPAPVTIDLNATPVALGSSSGGMRKRRREMPANMLTGARNLFDGMPAAVDDETTNCFLENMIFEGAPTTGAYDSDETQSQDGRAPFTQATNDLHDAFMQDQVGLDGFSLDHKFPEDYNLEEEDGDMDIDGEPLFEEELTNQTAVGAKPKRKSKRTKAYTL
ncbi:DNA repair protein rhp54 [Hordeum vulgare]|nr:DNA repair protein rhp54 [Hordeum vulgare]